MAIIRCDKGHYYDNTKFSQCPHCGVLPILEQEQVQEEKKEPTKHKRFSFFHKDKRAKTSVQPKTSGQSKTPAYDQESAHADPLTPAYEEELDHTMAMGIPVTPDCDEDDHTMAMGQSLSSYDEEDDHTVAISVHSQTPIYGEDQDGGAEVSKAPNTVFDDDDDDHTVGIPKPRTSVFDDDDDDHTIAIPKTQSPVFDDDDDRTIAIPKSRVPELDNDDDHTIAIPKSRTPELDDDDDHTIAIPKSRMPELDDDDDHTIAISKSRTSELDDDDDHTIAIPKGTVFAGNGDRTGAPGFQTSSGPEALASQASAALEAKAFSGPEGKAEENVRAKKARPAEPVAGWLVCTEGPERGCDYSLYKGFNRLGGGDSLDITVRDPKLGEAAVLAVVYDDRNNEFFAVQQAGGEALLNGAKLEKAAKLSTGDLLKAGESEFEFVAFCREGRTWSVND